MSNIKNLISNPYKNVDISLIVPSVSFDLFLNLYKSLTNSTEHENKAEILIKLDNNKEFNQFYSLLQSSSYKYKIIIYPQFNGRHSLHHFFNDLAAISSGKIIWILNDDATVRGNWYKTLMKTRNTFKDNIYCVAIPYNNGKGTKQIIPLPAISREWYNTFDKNVTRFPNFDRWLHEMSSGIKRRILIKEKDLVVDMPQGRRVLSKQERKTVFFPAVKKMLHKMKKRT